MMVARTAAIDADLRNAATPQVIILGAGFDGRAWRMRELVTSLVFEVDHPTPTLNIRRSSGWRR
jgi:O-methyltransferase involved in polyketide biosynthesis